MLVLSIIIALLVSSAVAWIVYRADKKREVPKPFITAALRGLLVFLTILLIIAPKIKKRNTEELKPIVLLVQDNSLSVKKALGSELSDYTTKLTELNKKLANKYRLITWNLDGAKNKDSLIQFFATSTNLAQPLSEASELYNQQNLSAIILASDGWHNEGNNPIYSELALKGSLYSIAIGDSAIPQDIKIAKVYANKSTSLNSQWEVRADIVANRCKGAQQNIVLKDAQGNSIASAPIAINSDKFDASVSFSVKANKVGLQQYSISTAKIGNEQNTANNSNNVFVEVLEDKKKVLLIAAAPHPDIKAIADAIKGLDQYELSIKMANEIPSTVQEYACIIAHQLPSNNTSTANLKGKNVWYIAGVQNNYFELNQLQKTITFGLGIATRATEAQYNKSFSSFSLPSNTAAISDILPPLSISATEYNAQSNAQVIFTDVNEKALWALSSGQVNTAVLCGEGIWRWRMYEYKNTKQHSVIDECIRQTLNFLTANNNAKPFRTELVKYIWNNPEHIHVNAFLYNANNEQINTPDARISIKDSIGKTLNYSFERNGAAYRIDLGALAPGTYTYTASTTLNTRNLSDEGKFLVTASTLEDQENGCNYPLLYALSQKNNGSVFSTQNMMSIYDSVTNNNAIKTLLSEHIESADLINWKWFFVLILALATAEWLLRKYWMAM